MSNFMDGIKSTLNNECNVSVTENGAVGFRTTGKALLDLNFAVASLRSASEHDISQRFTKAFFEDKLMAMKWLFYARDVRGGLGERRLFRACMVPLAKEFPEYVAPVVALVPEYGRWDDLWCLLDTPVCDCVTGLVKEQLYDDAQNAAEGKPISLLAKWMPRCKTSSKQTRHYAQILRKAVGMTERQYQHTLANLSRYLLVVEQQMTAKQWEEIDYQRVPSRANLQYNSAFLRHDEDRRRAFLGAVEKGEAKINASVLFPHDIVHRYGYAGSTDANLEVLWKNLPDTVQGCGNTIVVADGSGSMRVRVGNTDVSALEVANSLAIYFAERSSGQFKDQYITFSEHPQLVDLSRGKNLREKLRIAATHNEVANTNIEAVFDLILTTAINKHMDQSDLPANILIISDMEFDGCATTGAISHDRWGYSRRVAPTPRLFEVIAQRYAEAGYQIPRLVFWNVNSRSGTIPVKENDLGVALVSGFSPNIGKKKIASIKYSDVKAFYNKLIKEKGFKPNSMEIIHTIIHPIFTLAVRDNYIRINPATGAMAEIKKSHNWEKPKRHALTIAEQTAFIDYMRNHKVYNHWLPLFTVLLGTGCRIGEAIGLRWEDCDFDEGIISINHNMVYRKYEEDEKARFHIVTPKTSAGVRIVPMLSEVKAALQAEWETQKIVGFNESVVDGYAGFIFQNRYGDPLSPHSVNRAIDRICAAYIEDETVLADQEGRDPVLIRHFSAHNLRHTFCTRFCENERNIKVIQEIMGHADIETTMNIYAEATKEKKKESFSNLEGKIKIS